MTRERRRQVVLRPEEIDRAGLPVVLAKDADPLLVVRRKIAVDAGDRAHHFFPAELVCEELWQGGGVRGLGTRWLEMNRAHVGDEFFGRKNWKNGRREKRSKSD